MARVKGEGRKKDDEEDMGRLKRHKVKGKGNEKRMGQRKRGKGRSIVKAGKGKDDSKRSRE